MNPNSITLTSPELSEKFSLQENTLVRMVKTAQKDSIALEIGDSKQSDFKPQFKIMRWDNEVNFSMRAEEQPDAKIEIEGDVIKYITQKYEVHQYEKPEAGEDGGFEFEWVLNEKPDTNVLVATIQTKGLDFFYQPALNQEKLEDSQTADATHIYDNGGNVVGERPDNVVGSYAVYHATKGGMNDAAGMEYKTGKAFHIYRPQVTDAKGNQTWCDLNIDEASGALTVTVPQKFLDEAVYPVKVDPTFGYTTQGGTSNSANSSSGPLANVGSSVIYTASSGDTITSYSICASIGSGTYTVNLTAYTVSGGHAVTRLPSTATATVGTTKQFYQTTTISDNLVAGTQYGVAQGIYQSATLLTTYYDTGSAGDTDADVADVNLLPSSWNSAATVARLNSQYATYTASGGDTVSQLPLKGA